MWTRSNKDVISVSFILVSGQRAERGGAGDANDNEQVKSSRRKPEEKLLLNGSVLSVAQRG